MGACGASGKTADQCTCCAISASKAKHHLHATVQILQLPADVVHNLREDWDGLSQLWRESHWFPRTVLLLETLDT